MIQTTTILALAILLESINPFKGVVIGSTIVWILVRKRFNHLWIVGFAVLYALRLFLVFPVQELTEGRIVELNPSSVLVINQTTKALVTHVDPTGLSIGDHLSLENCHPIESSPRLFGFNGVDWANAQSIVLSCESKGIIMDSNAFFRWISGTDLNPQFQAIWRTLVLQSSELDSLAWLVSLGLIFQFILGGVKKILNPWVNDFIILLIQFSLGIGLGFILGYPLALIRILVRLGIKYFIPEPKERWIGTILSLGVINPYGFTQISWALPLSLNYLSSFKPVSYTWFSQSMMVFTVFMKMGFPIHVLQVALFKWIRKAYPWILAVLLIGRWNIMFQTLWLRLIPYIENQSLSLGWIHTKLTLLSFVGLIVLLSEIYVFSERMTLSIWLGILFILNPLSLIPWVSQLTVINVGQGDSMLIQTALNRDVYLVDTGPKQAWDHLDSVLSGLGIRNLDGLILTHADADHSANQEQILEHYVTHEVIIKGKDIPILSGYFQFMPLEGMMNPNDASLMYRLTLFDVNVCLMADVSTFAEAQLIKQNPNLRCSVLKVGHHGSKTSSSLRFLQTIEPQLAIVSVGKNTYGHPSIEVLKRLDSLNVETILTLKEGDLQFYISPWFTLIRSAPFSFRFYLS